jgi:glycosyltransferase involved in cell wall biosynthesis
MPIVSIIIPVYKVENYLHRCIGSILNQTYRDFELILIDDGSPDNCGLICDEYAAKDERIRVIHQENHGAAAARNKGLDHAKGNYIAFCDSDDLVAPQWLEHLLNASSPDTLPMCAYCNEIGQLGSKKSFPFSSCMLLPSSDYYTFNCYGLAGYLWNSLYDNCIIQKNNLRIRERKEQGDYNEDLLFALQYVRYVKNIVYNGYCDYLYDIHEGSLSRNGKKYYFDKYAEKYDLWRAFLEEHYLEDQMLQLANTYLYHFLVVLNWVSYQEFQKIVTSPSVQHCIAHTRNSAESPRLIRLLRKKKTRLLWLTYKLHHMKGRLI